MNSRRKPDFIADQFGNVWDVRNTGRFRLPVPPLDGIPDFSTGWFPTLGMFVMGLALLTFWGGSIVFVYRAICDVFRQDDVLRTYVPVRAEVIDSECHYREELNGSFPVYWVNKLYEIRISYRYTVDGKEYVSGRQRIKEYPEFIGESFSGQVMPLGEKGALGSEGWVNSIVARYKQGKMCQAYYNPTNHSESFLVHEHDFSPYAITIIGAAAFSLCFLSLVIGRWYYYVDVVGKMPEKSRLARASCHTCLTISFGVCAFVLGHYFLYIDRPPDKSGAPLGYSLFVGIAFGIYLICMILPPALSQLFLNRKPGSGGAEEEKGDEEENEENGDAPLFQS
jgi:hypothetical protein